MCAAKIFQILEGHSSDVMSCDFSGDCLATCSADKSIRIWVQKSDGKFVEADFSPLTEHTYGVNCIRFSPFGTLLASCSTDGRAVLWNIQDGEKLAELQHLKGSPIRVCSFSPTSGTFATGGDDEKVVLWDIATKSVIRVLEGHEAMITALAFTPDSAFLISCSSAGDIMLWDARYGHGKCLSFLTNAHDLGILSCDSSPQYEAVSEYGFLCGNYTIATCGNDDLVKIWSVQTSSTKSISLIKQLESHSGNVMSCRFSADGTILASTGGDRVVILWNLQTGQIIQKLDGHTRYITCCVFINSNMLATGSNDKSVIIWALNKDTLLESTLEFSQNGEENSKVNTKRSVLSWSVEEVITWLKSIKLDEFIEEFQSNSIDGKELMYLNHEILLNIMKIESLGKRNKIIRGIQCLRNPLWQHVLTDVEDELVFGEFYCPITHEIMRNPVVAADGYSYERQAIEEWLESGKDTSPMTNEALAHKLLTPNHILVQMIHKCLNA